MNKYEQKLKKELTDIARELRLIKEEIKFCQRHDLPCRHALAVRKQKDLTESFQFFIMSKKLYASYRTKMYLIRKQREG